MKLETTHTLSLQFKEIELNINEREQEISHIIHQHNVPLECFDREFNVENYDFKTDTAKQACLNVIHLQREMQEYINTFCISRDRLQARTHRIDDIDIVNSQAAKMAIVKAYLSLVINIAKKHKKNTRNLELSELIHEGNCGLMKAVEKFDYQSGYKFNTYATWWVRQSISRAVALAEGKDVPKPKN